MIFNINQLVKVKLNGHGVRCWLQYCADIGIDPIKLNVDSDGFTKFQMSFLMSVFGKYILNGEPLPFDSDIVLEVSA